MNVYLSDIIYIKDFNFEDCKVLSKNDVIDYIVEDKNIVPLLNDIVLDIYNRILYVIYHNKVDDKVGNINKINVEKVINEDLKINVYDNNKALN